MREILTDSLFTRVTRVIFVMESPHLAPPANKTCLRKHINYICCIFSVTFYWMSYFDRSLKHGNLTYSKHMDHVILTAVRL